MVILSAAGSVTALGESPCGPRGRSKSPRMVPLRGAPKRS
jgi:hypothetical protein